MGRLNITALLIFNLAGIISATPRNYVDFYLKRDVLYIFTGIALFEIFRRIDTSLYTYSRRFITFIFFASFILLLFYGVELKGTKGWFKFLKFYIQPTEILKPFYIVIISDLFDRTKKNNLMPHLFFIFTAILILLEPDVSGVIPYLVIYIGIGFLYGMSPATIAGTGIFAGTTIFLSTYKVLLELKKGFSLRGYEEYIYQLTTGNPKNVIVITLALIGFAAILYIIKKRILLYTVILPLLAGVYVSIFTSKFVKEYHIKRISTYINPKTDPFGYGYNLKQSIVSIGAGGLVGSGGRLTSAQLGLLPSAKTDFIFSVIAERGGIVFSGILLLLYYFLLRSIYKSILLYGITPLERTILAGFLLSFGFNIIYNLLMCTGILPVIGIPLPFLSYGGSYMAGCFISLGIIHSIVSKTRG